MKFLVSAAFLIAVCGYFGPANQVVNTDLLGEISGAHQFPTAPPQLPPCNRVNTKTRDNCDAAGGCNTFDLFKYNSVAGGNNALLNDTNVCGDWPQPNNPGWTQVDLNGDGDFDDPGETTPTNPCTGAATDESITLNTPPVCI